MAEVKPPRPRNVLVAEFPGLSKDDASQALRDAGGDLGKARKLVKSAAAATCPIPTTTLLLETRSRPTRRSARQLQAELNGEGPGEAFSRLRPGPDRGLRRRAFREEGQGAAVAGKKRGTARMFAEMSCSAEVEGLAARV